jgi:hypothetical protein
MDANTVIAMCATVIALSSLAVSLLEVRAVRQHNRHAVRPLLQLWVKRRPGGTTGIMLANRGLGPAIVTRSSLKVDGRPAGKWNEAGFNPVRASSPVVPQAMTIDAPMAIPAGFESFVMSLDAFDRLEHAWFWELIRQRIQLEVHYESLYGGEDFNVALNVDETSQGADEHQPGPICQASDGPHPDGAFGA